MAEIAPLTPLRYDLARAPLASVICPPYDVISEDERKQLFARHPQNVVRLELPEGEGESKYANAAALVAEWTKSGVLVRDNEPAFYRYDQSFLPPGGGTQTITRRGFFAAVRLHPFSERIVLPHERTLSGPKEDRLKLFRATRTQVSPGLHALRRRARNARRAARDGQRPRRVRDARRRPPRPREGHRARRDRRDRRRPPQVVAPHRRRPPSLRDRGRATATRSSRPARTQRRRRAPLLHDVPRERRRPEPRRLSDAPARSLAAEIRSRRGRGEGAAALHRHAPRGQGRPDRAEDAPSMAREGSADVTPRSSSSAKTGAPRCSR